jgi:hypothetical protein
VREDSQLSEHLIQLLDQLEPEREQLLVWVEGGCAIDWFCFVEAGDLERAIELDHGLLTRLAAIPGPLLIDTYGIDG